MNTTGLYSPLPNLHADDEEISNYAGLLDSLDIGLVVFSSETVLCFNNKTAERFLGAEPHNWKNDCGQSIPAVEFPTSIAFGVSQPVFDRVLVLEKDTGTTIRLKANALPVFSANGRVRRVLLTLDDISKERHAKDEQENVRIHDPLTGVFNKQHVMFLLGNEIHRARRYGTPFTLAQIDIDLFLPFCAEQGTERGDLVLMGIGKLLKESLREIDIIGRIGNDNFLLILPNVSLNEALIGLERLRVLIETHEFFDEALRVTISGGIAEHTGETPEALVERTKSLMAHARQAGRNRYCLDMDIL